MRPVRLVSFDVFGTLLDWRRHVEATFPGRYAAFCERSAELQRPDAAYLPYAELLTQVATTLGAPATAARAFGEGFGEAPAFADALAVQHLGQMTAVAFFSNADHRHAVAVQRRLGAVDLYRTAADWGAYKPHDAAWDAIERAVTRELRVAKDDWLHVSAFTDFDLAPAKRRGVRTAFLPRPGGSASVEAEALGVDLVVSDLWDLAARVAAANGRPVRYEVRATAKSEDVAARFRSWMLHEHGADLLGVAGCRSFQVVAPSALETVCEYVFTSRSSLDRYFSEEAPRLRARGRELFPEGDVTFARADHELWGGHARPRGRELA